MVKAEFQSLNNKTVRVVFDDIEKNEGKIPVAIVITDSPFIYKNTNKPLSPEEKEKNYKFLEKNGLKITVDKSRNIFTVYVPENKNFEEVEKTVKEIAKEEANPNTGYYPSEVFVVTHQKNDRAYGVKVYKKETTAIIQFEDIEEFKKNVKGQVVELKYENEPIVDGQTGQVLGVEARIKEEKIGEASIFKSYPKDNIKETPHTAYFEVEESENIPLWISNDTSEWGEYTITDYIANLTEKLKKGELKPFEQMGRVINVDIEIFKKLNLGKIYEMKIDERGVPRPLEGEIYIKVAKEVREKQDKVFFAETNNGVVIAVIPKGLDNEAKKRIFQNLNFIAEQVLFKNYSPTR